MHSTRLWSQWAPSALAAALPLVLLLAPGLDARGRRDAAPRCLVVAHAAPTDGSSDRSRHPRPARSFDIHETSAIELDVYCARSAPTDVRVELFLPNGDLYEALDATPLAERGAARGRRPRRLPAATARLPVTGTYITQYGLVGPWRARACDDAANAATCGVAWRFTLER